MREPFETFIAPLAKRWADFDMSRIRHPGPVGSLKLTVNCNWKLAVENYCRSYHLPSIHPGLNSYSKLEDHYHIEGEDHFSGQGTHVYAPLLVKDGPNLPQFPNLPAAGTRLRNTPRSFPMCCSAFTATITMPSESNRSRSDVTNEHLEIYYIDDASADPRFWGMSSKTGQSQRAGGRSLPKMST